MLRKGLLFLGFLLGFHFGITQKLDSLNHQLEILKKDSNYVKTIRELTLYYLFDEPDFKKALDLTDKGINHALKIKDNLWTGRMYALKAYIQSGYASQIQEAISSNFKALEYLDKTGKDYYKIVIYLNLGVEYHEYGQIKDALKYLRIGEEIAVKYNAEDQIADFRSNIGQIYGEMRQYDKAEKYLNSALEYYKKGNNELGTAQVEFAIINNTMLRDKVTMTERKKAIEIYKRIYPVFEKYGSFSHYIITLSNLAVELKILGKLDEAYHYLLLAEKTGEETNDYKHVLKIYHVIADYFYKKQDYKMQAEYLQKIIKANDSLFNQEKAKTVSEVQIKYQTEKIEAQNKILHQDSEIKDLELSKKDIEIAQSNTIKFALIGGLTMIIVFTAFLYNRFKLTNQQKKTIEQQKLIVEIKQKEITDSIKYAKRLQEAILPSQDVIKKHLPDSFLLYKPKDIVAGDFYFFETNDDAIYIAAADCTGHGVPGAMVSVVCSNALHRTIREFEIKEPGKILDKTRELVVETFEKSGQEVKDGMDIALCSIKNGKLSFSGANNSCWILRGEEYIVLPADKQPIGKFEKSFPYTTQVTDLQKGDQIYIFTDGYNDQFGGKEGKKFKAKNFFNLLKSIQYYKMEEQKREIDKVFETWKGSLEQIDDVCIIGIRV